MAKRKNAGYRAVEPPRVRVKTEQIIYQAVTGIVTVSNNMGITNGPQVIAEKINEIFGKDTDEAFVALNFAQATINILNALVARKSGFVFAQQQTPSSVSVSVPVDEKSKTETEK